MTEHVDSQLLAELQTFMEDDFGKLLRTYLSESAQQFDVARAACDRGDLEVLRRSAHSLKGSSLNIGAHRLAKLCAELEVGARAEASDAMAELFGLASAELDSVQVEVRALYQRL